MSVDDSFQPVVTYAVVPAGWDPAAALWRLLPTQTRQAAKSELRYWRRWTPDTSNVVVEATISFRIVDRADDADGNGAVDHV